MSSLRAPASTQSESRGRVQDHDDYNAIMVKAVADRPEAFAEYRHAQARKDWATARPSR